MLITAAPQVAGLIATYFSDTTRKYPWEGKEDLERVIAIREYLLSPNSSWERVPGFPMIWNGASQDDHNNASVSHTGK